MFIQIMQEVTQKDLHLQQLEKYIINGWLNKQKVAQDIHPYWEFRDNLAGTVGVVMNSRQIITPEGLQEQVIESYIIIV